MGDPQEIGEPGDNPENHGVGRGWLTGDLMEPGGGGGGGTLDPHVPTQSNTAYPI